MNFLVLRLLKLEILDLKNVGILSFPFVIHLADLTVLRLDGNKIMGNIPAGLSGLTKLTSLWLHQNKFTGSIPEISVESLTDITL